MAGNVVHCIFYREDFVCICIWDLDLELLLKGHDQLYNIQAVQPKVLLKVCRRQHLHVHNSGNSSSSSYSIDPKPLLKGTLCSHTVQSLEIQHSRRFRCMQVSCIGSSDTAAQITPRSSMQ